MWGSTKEDTENFLIDLGFLGIDNVMVLRGDAVKSETYFSRKEGHAYMSQLVGQILTWIWGSIWTMLWRILRPPIFVLGLRVILKSTWRHQVWTATFIFKKKIAKGAAYIVTQMFSTIPNTSILLKMQKRRHYMVPIIPGLKPLATWKQLNLIPHRFKCGSSRRFDYGSFEM